MAETPEIISPIKRIALDGSSDALVGRLHSTRFRIVTLVLLGSNPELNVYEMNAEDMKEWIEEYEHYGEYILAVEPLDNAVLQLVKH